MVLLNSVSVRINEFGKVGFQIPDILVFEF